MYANFHCFESAQKHSPYLLRAGRDGDIKSFGHIYNKNDQRKSLPLNLKYTFISSFNFVCFGVSNNWFCLISFLFNLNYKLKLCCPLAIKNQIQLHNPSSLFVLLMSENQNLICHLKTIKNLSYILIN